MLGLRRGVLFSMVLLGSGCATQRAAEQPAREEAFQAEQAGPAAAAEPGVQLEPGSAPHGRFLSPAEIMQRVTDSKVEYILGDRAKFQEVYPKGYARALWPQWARPLDTPKVVQEGGHRTLVPYPFDPRAEPLVDQADALMGEEKFAEADQLYARILREFPDHYLAWAYQGNSALRQGDLRRALELYAKAIQLNPDDYRLYFFKGLALAGAGRMEEARQALAWTLVLNPRYQILRDLLSDQPIPGLELREDVLVPQAFVRKEGDAKVFIYFDVAAKAAGAPWLAWANCKALWLGEPSHRQEMTGDARATWTSTEESECLANLWTVYAAMREKDAIPADPELDRLALIVEDKMADELILFEVATRIYPQLVLVLEDAGRQRLLEYVLKYVLVGTPESTVARPAAAPPAGLSCSCTSRRSRSPSGR